MDYLVLNQKVSAQLKRKLKKEKIMWGKLEKERK